MPNTSWNQSSRWYNSLVGKEGHHYHQTVIFPRLLPLLKLTEHSSLLDIGCGQGILAQQLPKGVEYVGIDTAAKLIEIARKQDRDHHHSYLVKDASHTLPFSTQTFTHAVAMLSLQNMEFPEKVIANVAKCLKPRGTLTLVLNHPAFRIPRQSGWGETDNKIQYRYVNRYLSPLKIPITMHPGQRQSDLTWSFHQPLSAFTKMLFDNGFVIEQLEELTSDKESQGKSAKQENRARAEIPLFMIIKARLDS